MLANPPREMRRRDLTAPTRWWPWPRATSSRGCDRALLVLEDLLEPHAEIDALRRDVRDRTVQSDRGYAVEEPSDDLGGDPGAEPGSAVVGVGEHPTDRGDSVGLAVDVRARERDHVRPDP